MKVFKILIPTNTLRKSNTNKKIPCFEDSKNDQTLLIEIDSKVDLSLSSIQQSQHEVKNDIKMLDRTDIKIGKLLGTGSFSNVHEVTLIKRNKEFTKQSKNRCHIIDDSKNQSERYVIKCLRKKLFKSMRYSIKDFEGEGRFLALLDHKNIVKLYGLPLHRHTRTMHFGAVRRCNHFIVMERLQETLGERIRAWKLPKNKDLGDSNVIYEAKIMTIKCSIAIQIARAILYIHREGIIYRDLKPSNIGFKEGNQVRLFDFGLARQLPLHEESQDGCYRMSIAGSRRYMAPEIFNTGRYNTNADVYSWSMVFYQMIVLKKPFDKFDDGLYQEFVVQIGERPDIAHLQLPHGIEKLLENCWSHDLSRRLSSIDLCDKLEMVVKCCKETEDALNK